MRWLWRGNRDWSLLGGFGRVVLAGLVGVVGVLVWSALAGGTQPYESYESTVALDGPVAQFRFDDAVGSSTLVDSAGSYTASNSGIVLGGEGPFGGSKSGAFGGEAFATLPADPLAGASAFTAEAWVDWGGATLYKQPVFDFGSSSTNYMYLTPASALSDHKMLFEIRTSAGTVFQVTATKLKASAWEYLAVTETSSGTLTLYLNGEQVGQTTGVTISPASLGSTPDDFLGKPQVSGEPMFDGSMSNVAFYNKALSASQILAHYNAGEYPVNTVLPTISGTAKDGKALSAKAGTWTGLTPITFAYQWTRCNASGAECTSIGSATEAKYTLGHEDVGRTVRVAVSATNSAGAGSATSAQTVVIAAIKPSNTALPVISGTPNVGQLLSVSNGGWEGSPVTSYAYQWEACNNVGAKCKEIAGATASTYRVIPYEIADTLRAVVTASNSGGSASATSSLTGLVGFGVPVNTALPAVSGTSRDGQTLTASSGSWAGTEPITYAYQWQSCNGSGEDCTNISGATSSSYMLGPSNVGSTLDVVVTAKNAIGSTSATSPVTAVVAAIPPSNTALPTITGTATDGQTLMASTGSWTGTPPLSYSYQWQSCNGAGESCANVSGATGSTYLLGHGDVGNTLRVVVTASNAGGSVASASEATGVVASGFTVLTYASQFGSAGSGNGQFSHPGDVAVDSDGDLWVLDSGNGRVEEFNDNGEYMKQFGSRGSGAGQLDSPDGIVVDSSHDVWVVDTGNDRVEEFNESGECLQAFGSGRLRDAEGIAVDRHGDVWVSNTSEGRLVVFNGQGEYLKSVGSKGSGAGQIGEPEGVAIDSNGDVWVADWSNDRVEEFNEEGGYMQQFGAAGSGDGQLREPYGIAVGSAGDVFVGEVGNDRVQEFNDSGEYVSQLGSPGSAAGDLSLSYPMGLAVDSHGDVWVTDSNNDRIEEWAPEVLLPPTSTAAPVIEGTPEESQTLSASDGAWSGAPPLTYSYQWQRCDSGGGECQDISGATSRTYTLGGGDVGSTLRVLVTASNAEGSATAGSPSSPVVAPGTPPSNTNLPVVSGTAQQGQTLTVSTGSWTGTTPIAYAYQWESCNASGSECAAIEGATGAEYDLGEGDIGTTVRVAVTASNSLGSARALSPASAQVEPEPTSEVEAPSVSGTPDSDQVLSANPGVWAGTEVQLGYQWESCSPSGVECAAIEGATGTEYDLGEGDVGTTLRVRVGAGGAVGSLSDVSPVTPVIGAAGALASTSAPGIAGAPQSGQTLTASAGGWSGAGAVSYAYQWQGCERYGSGCEAIEGATGSTYTPGFENVGRTLRVLVTASEEGHSLSRVSPATQPVAAAEAPAILGPPVIAGTALRGHTLTATTGAWSGEGAIAYTYQWERCKAGSECASIEGATAGSYTLTEDDVGSTLLVLVTATGAGGSSIGLSTPTAVIEPESIVVLSAPSIAGVVQSGGTLSSEPGIWSGAGHLSYAYQWESCNPGGSECAPVEDATESSYLLTGGDLGSTVRVEVTATDPLGGQSALSAHTIVVPGGEASVEEAQQAAQQVDPSLLAPSTTASLEGQTIAPALADTGNGLASQQTLSTSSVSKEAPGELAVNTPAGELGLTPLESSPNASGTPTIVNGAAALFANTWPATDTIVRAEPLGATTILQLRSAEAPSTFSWEVGLGPDQQLKQLPDGSIAVINTPEGPEETGGAQRPKLEPGEGAPQTSAEEEEAEQEAAASEAVQTKGEATDEVPPEALPAAPLSTTPEVEPVSGQPQPQDTQAEYEAASAAVASSEAQTADQTLMVIQAPTVTDAAAHSIPASLRVSGDTITLTIKPASGATFPLLAATTIAAPSDKTSEERDPVTYGLADDRPQTFTEIKSEPNITNGPLKVHTARLVIPYDTFAKTGQKYERERLKSWLAAVEADKLQPYVTLGEDEKLAEGCAEKVKPCVVPSRSEYRADFTKLVQEAPGVKLWGAWNEPDIGPDPLHLHSERAAQFWQIAQSVVANPKLHCACKVVAGEFAFATQYLGGYISSYEETILHNKHHPLCKGCWPGAPHIWGFHDYRDVEERDDSFAEKFKAFTERRFPSARIWIGEAAVELQNNGGPTELAEGDPLEQRMSQTKAAEDFLHLYRVSSKIERVYYYQYRAPTEKEQEEWEKGITKHAPFDSGLVEAEPEPSKPTHKSKGEARWAYCVLMFNDGSCQPTVTDLSGLYISAIVTPNGMSTTVLFELGPQFGVEGDYTTSEGTPQSIGDGLQPIELSTMHANNCGPLHFRAVATNASGTTYGSDQVWPYACT